ncbi:MAG: hypothetical protein AAF558_11410 [Verrucomicrobiota bacterium]
MHAPVHLDPAIEGGQTQLINCEEGTSALLQSLGYNRIGSLPTKPSSEIKSSPWSIGCETLDRDYVDFSHSGKHLGDLGAKSVRLQAGWAKCEPDPGNEYKWDWLDEIIDTAHSYSISPWLQLSYGNPAYPGGGGVGLAESIPRSEIALNAWDEWVKQVVVRYCDTVTTWEIWNEPDSRDLLTPEDYAIFFIRTAEIIRKFQTHSTIIGGAVARHDSSNYSGRFLEALDRANKSQLLDELSYHFYPHNPDEAFEEVTSLENLCRRHAPHVKLRQGETGAPSESLPFLALGQHPWSERKQAVWNLRRLLSHHARGIPMNLFQLADMHYKMNAGSLFEGRNSKGLLCIRSDKTVAYRKPSFRTAQIVFSLWDDRFPLKSLSPHPVQAATPTRAFAWHSNLDELCIHAWWRHDLIPALETLDQVEMIFLEAVKLKNQILVDLLSGDLFLFHSKTNRVPCLDSPLALMDPELVGL